MTITSPFSPFRHESIPLLILTLFLIIGFVSYRDYGIAWDEQAQMVDIGKATYEFIINKTPHIYINNKEKYHGPAFEVVVYSLQSLFGKTSNPDNYYFRHLISYILYWLGGLSLFLLLRKIYKSYFIISIGLLWYFLMPRFFAESFFNSKDIAFYVFTIFSIHSLFNLIKNPGYKNAFIHALVCGFAIGIRITGILIPLISITILGLTALSNIFRGKSYKKLVMTILQFTPLTIAFIIIFWPILWLDPVHHFLGAFQEMKLFPWDSTVRYQGNFISSLELPWHYSITWMLITIPELILIFFALAILYLIKKVIKLKQEFINKYPLEFFSISLLILTLGSVIYNHSVLYDGWRHLFFLFAPILFISISGLQFLIQQIKDYTPLYKTLTKSIILIFTFQIGYVAFTLHPYQNVYFNTASGINNESKRFEYELDYWGLSFREATEKLLEQDTSYKIKIHFPNNAGHHNLSILNETQRNRIIETSFEEADYFITNYRWGDREFTELNKIDSIMAGNIPISGTFKLK